MNKKLTLLFSEKWKLFSILNPLFKAVLGFVGLLFSIYPKQGLAQLPYTTAQYSYDTSSHFIGSYPNYCGNTWDLNVKIYKPVNNDKERPVIVLVHGGGFSSNENFRGNAGEFMQRWAVQFAQRGYVAVTTDYREGMHIKHYPASHPNCFASLSDFAADPFITDQAELERAIFRAQQDVKQVIRFMKSRSATDSSSKCKFFLAGHSAGAITVLNAAFVDLPSEKNTSAGVMNTVTNPNWTNDWGQNFFQLVGGPKGKENIVYRKHNPLPFNYENANCYLRPDLGTVDGDEASINENTKIMGVASVAGALIDLSILDNQKNNYNPALYLYHTDQDQVVYIGYGKPFGLLNLGMSVEANANWPWLYGSDRIRDHINTNGYNNSFYYERRTDAPITSGHDPYPSHEATAANVANFFAAVMDTTTMCSIPVSMSDIELNGNIKQGKAELVWKTDIQVASFVIERSTDGRAFDVIGLQSGVAGQAMYYYTDNQMLSNQTVLYRIKAFGQDGQIKFSNVLSLKKSDKQTAYSIYPTLVSKNIQIKNHNAVAKRVNITITNAMGKTEWSAAMDFGSQEIKSIDLSQVGSGMYYITIKDGNNTVVVERIVRY